MPILCPGAGSLWRLGKHSRHGGRRSNSRHSNSGSRPVNARGTFTQNQVDVGPSMSPSSTGGVYLGPEKKVSSTTTTTSSSARDKKLADIRSPTDYYTDGNVFIGQDVIKDVELDTHNSSEHPDILHPMRSEHTNHDDTLNPDGTLASIVFFEETFMSAKFSHLTTSSPGCTANKQLDATTSSLPNQSGLQETRGFNSTIPSWVRQRRCLPTLDEVDFDQIDLISLHSLPTNEQTHSPGGPNGVRSQTDAKDQTSIVNDHVNKNCVKITERMTQPRSQKQRSVLGDLTNTDNSSAPKGTSKVTNQSAFYKIPKRVSVRERRSRRHRRTSNNRKVKPSSSRESLVNALDKPNEHTYVNLDYIAGIMTNSPSKDGSEKMNESIHDYENVWSNSPIKPSAVQKRMRSLESDGQSRISSSVNNTAKQDITLSQNRRKLDQGQIPDLWVGLPSMTPSPRIKPIISHNSQSVQGALKNYMVGIKEANKGDGTYKKETLSSTSSWESAAGSHSTEGDECAAILYGGAKNKTSHQQHASSGTNQEPKPRQSERRDKKYSVTIGKISDKRNDYVHVDSDTKKLVETPAFVGNAIRKARIVRTNSTEESSKEEQGVVKSQTSKRQTEFKPKKSSQIDSRRSLPAPSTLNHRSLQKKEQCRSTTNVREVEANLSQKQNRKIRRTIEGDEVLKALLDKPEPTSNQKEERKPNETFSDSHGAPRSGDEMSRVQKIIEDWNKCSERIAQRHGTTCYVGGHIHTTSSSHLPDQNPSQSESKDRRSHVNSGLKWIKGGRKNNRGGDKVGHPPMDTMDPRTIQTRVNQSSIRRIPSTYHSLTKTQSRRSTSHNVIEVYVTTQAYSSCEVDEIDAQRGEIVVINSAMQRENDWMWVYVPRSDRFGYLPAFAARPLEFEIN